MLKVHAQNITGDPGHRADGSADYQVKIFVNETLIADLYVNRHDRASGGPALLRLIADEWDLQAARARHRGDAPRRVAPARKRPPDQNTR